MAGGGGHNKRDGNRYEDRGAEVELLVLGKLFEALVENRNQLKSEKSLNTRKYHACLLNGLAASLIRLLVQLPRPMARKHNLRYQEEGWWYTTHRCPDSEAQRACRSGSPLFSM